MYNQNGEVVAVPAAGTSFNLSGSRRANCYQTKEQDGYIYVRLATEPSDNFLPFAMPHYDESGWQTVRLTHRFQNNVTNCVENFIDTPHTAFVHPGVFRDQQQQQLEMHVERRDGAVFVEYHNEKTNLGWYRYFLNWHEQEIKHCDRFQMPNVTCVEYDMGKNRHLFITSQSIPEAEDSTLVYTDVTFNYGVWNLLARPFVRWTAQRIIRQDVEILQIQGETIAKYGSQFAHTPADTIHCFVESIRNAIARGEDPRQLPKQAVKVTFWV
jgi:phenylpropionate dioxygenase-like ring-hydroxylating dioxygenase large terminal subunit